MSTNYKDGIVCIMTKDSKSYLGTGFIISSNHILTCSHVIAEYLDNNNSIPIKYYCLREIDSDDIFKAKIVLNIDREMGDIALLYVDAMPLNVSILTLALSFDYNYKYLFNTIGFPVFEGVPLVFGTVAENIEINHKVKTEISDYFFQKKIDVYQFSNRGIRKGFSGSPAFIPELNYVIGMTSFVPNEEEGFLISANFIYENICEKIKINAEFISQKKIIIQEKKSIKEVSKESDFYSSNIIDYNKENIVYYSYYELENLGFLNKNTLNHNMRIKILSLISDRVLIPPSHLMETSSENIKNLITLSSLFEKNICISSYREEHSGFKDFIDEKSKGVYSNTNSLPLRKIENITNILTLPQLYLIRNTKKQSSEFVNTLKNEFENFKNSEFESGFNKLIANGTLDKSVYDNALLKFKQKNLITEQEYNFLFQKGNNAYFKTGGVGNGSIVSFHPIFMESSIPSFFSDEFGTNVAYDPELFVELLIAIGIFNREHFKKYSAAIITTDLIEFLRNEPYFKEFITEYKKLANISKKLYDFSLETPDNIKEYIRMEFLKKNNTFIDYRNDRLSLIFESKESLQHLKNHSPKNYFRIVEEQTLEGFLQFYKTYGYKDFAKTELWRYGIEEFITHLAYATAPLGAYCHAMKQFIDYGSNDDK